MDTGLDLDSTGLEGAGAGLGGGMEEAVHLDLLERKHVDKLSIYSRVVW